MTITTKGNLNQALNRLLIKKNMVVKTGIQDNSYDIHGKSNAVKAYLNEYGTKTIPPRPAMRNTVADFKAEWIKTFKAYLASGRGIEFTLNVVGEQMKTDMVYTYTMFKEPPNAKSTIRKKGFDKPLDDTGAMINSITSEVDEE